VRTVESQPALVEQDHRRGDRDRLGRRGHPEDRVPAHRRAAVVAPRPDRLDVRLVAPADQGDQARDPPRLDMPVQHVTHSVQP
jgi:hypothetical protein